ncbi:MAG: hypothetical protein ACO1NO_02520 [Burkholderiaceae bacterium]
MASELNSVFESLIMKKIISACLSMVLLVSVSSFAGGKHSHGDEHHPKYGGVVTELDAVQYELVARPDSIAIFIEDHGRKVDVKNATAKVTLLNGSEKTVLELKPGGENKLEVQGAFKVDGKSKAVAVVALSGKPAKSVRFIFK